MTYVGLGGLLGDLMGLGCLRWDLGDLWDLDCLLRDLGNLGGTWVIKVGLGGT